MNVIDRITINNTTKYTKDAAGQAMIATEEASTTAAAAHAIDSLFRLDGKLYKTTSAIAIGDTIAATGNSANCVETDIDGELIKDIQINGTSILNGGVANIPQCNQSIYGVTKIANSGYIKAGSDTNLSICPQLQHEAIFYGLAKAAGADMASSSNAVGTYTNAAKTAIKSMIGVVDATLDVTISGTTPTITATANTRYICGEVSTLSFTPSTTGICEVIFESGTTPTVLTLPNTVKLPSWFDATSLEASTTYEISITDGVYGVVASWQ